MTAMVCKGPCDVTVEEVADARTEPPTDTSARITATSICCSDLHLHLHKGRTGVEKGEALGHKGVGVSVPLDSAMSALHLCPDPDAGLCELTPVADDNRCADPSGLDEKWGLSRREVEVLEGVSRGMSNKELAAHLFLGVNTIKTYIRCAYGKIGVLTRPEAILWGVENGLHPDLGPRASARPGRSGHERRQGVQLVASTRIAADAD